MIMRLIRQPLGKLILLVDAATAPKRPQHDADVQARLDAATQGMALYQYLACPFCVKTRRAIRRLGLNITVRDAKHDARWRDELASDGGKVQVPCLKIERDDGSVDWLYESNDIIAFLQQHADDHRVATAA